MGQNPTFDKNNKLEFSLTISGQILASHNSAAD